MFIRPVKRMPKPMAILPTVREFLNFRNMIMTMPAIRAIGASVDGLKKRIHIVAESEMPRSRMIWPVTVVPTFAPMMMPSDWWSVRIPAATRPEVITMVAVEDWMSAVTRMPRPSALSGLSVSFSMTFFSVPEEPSFRESPMRRMP